MTVSFTLNGRRVSRDCPEGESLKSLLKRLGIVSIRDGCDGEGSCGLCAVSMDGKHVNSCLVLAAQAEGAAIDTIERFSSARSLTIVQKALVETGCVQCGYCTPAIAMALRELLERDPDPDDRRISDALSGTLCRCTGYEQFKSAAKLASRRLRDPSYAGIPAPEFRPDLRHVGKNREKVDAPALARGERAFVEDRVPADACRLKVLGSPYARAYIGDIDSSDAEAMPGVVAVVTWKNCPDRVYNTAGQGYPEPSPYDFRMFSRSLRFVGDRVAAVLAETEEEASAALAAIRVEYRILEPVLSMDAAGAPGAPLVHAGPVSYVSGSPPPGAKLSGDPASYAGTDDPAGDDPIVYQFPIGADPSRNLAASVSDGIGDIEKGFAEADAIVERTYEATRVQCTPMEPHVVLARTEAGRLVVHASTQVPWHLRRIVAGVLGIPENKVRVVKERVGGGFGAKQDIVVEDVACWLAWQTGRPVFFRYTREEEFTASRTRHPMRLSVRMGAKRDGRLTAIELRIDADTGAYGQHALTVPMNACSKSLPLLVCDNVRFDVKTWYTNLPPSGAYQGYGAPQGSFAVQAALAELAQELGIPQVEMIERNRVREGSRLEILRSLGEGREGQAVTLGPCGLGDMMDRARKDLLSRPKAVPAGPDWRIGRGTVIIQQGSGLPGLDAANAEIRLLSDGTFLLLSGGADLGTGLDTLAVKVAAETLLVDMDDVAIISGDTDITPFDKGAYASSGTFFSGNAALLAARDLAARILAAAAGILGEPVEALALEHRGLVRGRNGSVTFAEIAHVSVGGERFGELSGKACFKTEHAAFPYGVHAVEAAVNARTGEVRLLKYHAYQDCGTPINPELALGQVYGGVMKAIGHSLYEEMLFDTAGRCVNPRFLDYKIPSIFELPDDFKVVLMPVDDPVGPFGGKSISEIALNGAAPAIAIAIHDAIGAWVRTWPFTPERLLRASGALTDS